MSIYILIIDRRGVVLSSIEPKSVNKSQSRDTVISNKGFEAPDIPVQVMCNNLFLFSKYLITFKLSEWKNEY